MTMNNWLKKAYQHILKTEGIHVPEKHMCLWTKYEDQTTSLLRLKFENIIDLVILVLQFAEIRDYITTLYVSPYYEKCVSVSRNLYYWNLRDALDSVKLAYQEAYDNYGQLYVECNFPHTEHQVRNDVKELQHCMLTTTTMAIRYSPSENLIAFVLDDDEFNFRMFLDIFEDFRLFILPDGL